MRHIYIFIFVHAFEMFLPNCYTDGGPGCGILFWVCHKLFEFCVCCCWMMFRWVSIDYDWLCDFKDWILEICYINASTFHMPAFIFSCLLFNNIDVKDIGNEALCFLWKHTLHGVVISIPLCSASVCIYVILTEYWTHVIYAFLIVIFICLYITPTSYHGYACLYVCTRFSVIVLLVSAPLPTPPQLLPPLSSSPPPPYPSPSTQISSRLSPLSLHTPTSLSLCPPLPPHTPSPYTKLSLQPPAYPTTTSSPLPLCQPPPLLLSSHLLVLLTCKIYICFIYEEKNIAFIILQCILCLMFDSFSVSAHVIMIVGCREFGRCCLFIVVSRTEGGLLSCSAEVLYSPNGFL